MKILRIISSYAIVSRFEFAPCTILFTLIPIGFALIDGANIHGTEISMVFSFLVFFLAYLIGSKINCLTDYELDLGFKKRLPKAIDVLTKKTTLMLIIVETILATAMVIYLTVKLGRPILMGLWVIGVILATLYSVEPIRLKSRGWLNILTLILVLTFLPPLFIYLTLQNTVSNPFILILIALNIQIAAMITFNELEDYPEDSSKGVKNPCVLWGIKRTALFTLIVMIIGILMMMMIYVYNINKFSILQLIVPGIYLPIVYSMYQTFELSKEYEINSNEATMSQIRKIGKRLPVFLVLIGIPVIMIIFSKINLGGF